MRTVTDKITKIGDRKYEIRHAHGPASVIRMQDGPLGDFNNSNGCTTEDLINVCIDRIDRFQDGPLSCKDNGLAIKNLKGALGNLTRRMQKRIDQGVIGTMEPHSK